MNYRYKINVKVVTDDGPVSIYGVQDAPNITAAIDIFCLHRKEEFFEGSIDGENNVTGVQAVMVAHDFELTPENQFSFFNN